MLVKLASIGTAGVCVLAIFIIGTSIMRLKSDTPEWKVSLMKKYMNTCIWIAVICMISGGANAYFNQNKIKTANDAADAANERSEIAVNAFKQLEQNYEVAMEEIVRFKEDMGHQINQLELSLEQNDAPPQSFETLMLLRERSDNFRIRSMEEVTRGIDRDKLDRIIK
jgi:hypothetical protein